MSTRPLSIPRLRSRLTKHLRDLLCCLDKKQPLNYHECVKDFSSVTEILAKHLTTQKVGVRLASISGADESVYCVELLKRIILTQFELLCVSVELENDVESSFTECKKICQSTEALAQWCSTYDQYNPLSTCMLEFPDFAERLIKSHSKLISLSFLNGLNAHAIVHLAKFESVFIRALLGMFATYTTLLRPQGSKHKKMMYVSEDMFSLTQTNEKVSWLDCLIPGAQSEGLRLSWKELGSKLWGAVTDRVLECVQPVMADGWAVTELVPVLEILQKEEGLKPYPSVVKCLWSISASIRQQAFLMQWDIGFQQFLPALSTDSKKGYRPLSSEQETTKSASLMLNSVLPPLTHFMESVKMAPFREVSTTPLYLSQHLDELRMCQSIVAALEISLRQFSIFFTRGMTSCLINGNIRGLGQGLFVDVPAVTDGVCGSMVASRVAAPLFTFPSCTSPHLTECVSREAYSVLHTTYTALQECGEEVGVALNIHWKARCAQVLQSVFPTHKNWKAVGRKSGLAQLTPSDYCTVITEQLLSPVLEAALGLSVSGQCSLITFCITVLLVELRRVILSEGRTYKPSAGRQLLTDYRHLINWIITNTKSLSDTAPPVTTLPLTQGIEHGVLVLCGTAGSGGVTQEGGVSLSSLLPLPHLPLFHELAWLREDDWTKAIGS